MNIKTLFQADDERAVSPVIGVILMIAITVILAAVIGAFVLDLGSNQSQPAQAGFSVDESTSPYTVTLNSMGSNTEYVYCSSASDPGDASTASNSGNNAAGSVGEDFECSSSDSIIGVTDQGEENVVRDL